MPVIRGYVNGTTAGQPGPGSSPDQRSKRGRITGWTAAAVRRHTRWLYAVDAEGLSSDGLVGVSLTLTLLRTPDTPEEWDALRRAWIKAMQRAGVVRLHWVVEWQARRVPHMHLALYFPPEHDAEAWAAIAIVAWLQRAGEKYGAGFRAQYWNVIDGPLGWLQYLSKHAARGVAHYQRQGKPPGWETTGRLWGYIGDWPTVEPWTIDAEWAAFWRLRRVVRLWRLSDARSALRAAQTPQEARQARRRITFARRMLKSNDRSSSRVRGISEWVPLEQLERIVEELQRQGFAIATRDLLEHFPAAA